MAPIKLCIKWEKLAFFCCVMKFVFIAVFPQHKCWSIKKNIPKSIAGEFIMTQQSDKSSRILWWIKCGTYIWLWHCHCRWFRWHCHCCHCYHCFHCFHCSSCLHRFVLSCPWCRWLSPLSVRPFATISDVRRRRDVLAWRFPDYSLCACNEYQQEQINIKHFNYKSFLLRPWNRHVAKSPCWQPFLRVKHVNPKNKNARKIY